MRIGVDALTLGTGGGWVYLTNVLEKMAAINSRVKFMLYTSSSESLNCGRMRGNITRSVVSIAQSHVSARLLWKNFFLPVRSARADASVMLLPSGSSLLPPNLVGVPSVFVAQNMLAVDPSAFDYYYGNWRKQLWLFYLRGLTFFSCQVATHIIAISETLRQAIIKSFRISPERVTTVHYGIDHNLFQPRQRRDLKSVSSSLGLAPGYLLSVSSVFTYKNYLNLIRAYHRMRQDDGVSLPLVIVGEAKDKQYHHRIFLEIERLELQESVHMVGSVRHGLLPSLYSGAALYVFPSMCEAFGLTPLEAMSCGTPVVASNVSAMPEICDDAAVYFDPCDPKDMANKILQVLGDPVLQQCLVARGFERAKQFSWEQAARETLDILAMTANQ